MKVIISQISFPNFCSLGISSFKYHVTLSFGPILHNFPFLRVQILLHSNILMYFLFPSESKISELSEVVGSYERVRLQDQLTIQKLKDRLQQLDVENCVLLRRSGSDSDQDNTLSQIDTLQNQVKTLKGFIKLALEKTGKQQTFSSKYRAWFWTAVHQECPAVLSGSKVEFVVIFF